MHIPTEPDTVREDQRILTSCSFFDEGFYCVSEGVERRCSLEDFGFMVFHSPYCKLVQKSLARLMLNDFMCHPSPNTESGPFSGLEAFRLVDSFS